MYVLKLLGVHSGCIQLRPMHQLRNFANMLDIEIHVMNISKVGLLEILYFIQFALHVSELALIYICTAVNFLNLLCCMLCIISINKIIEELTCKSRLRLSTKSQFIQHHESDIAR